MKCFEQSKKLYWDIETKEEYDEVKKWSKNELLAAISDYVSDNADCEIYNIMYEYTCLSVCLSVCINVCMSVCAYVCIYM